MPALRIDALNSALQCGLAPLYVIHGEEMLLALEAADSIRVAAREAGYAEREILQVEGQFDWSSLNEAMCSVSLFSELKLLEIRIPNGKPGIDGAKSLINLAENPPKDNITLVVLPKLERSQLSGKWFLALSKAAQVIEARPVLRAELSGWIRERLLRQEQSIKDEALGFFVDRVEGNLLAAKQEVDKLSLLYPFGELSLEQVRASVANVARFDVFDLAENWMSGKAERTSRILDNLAAEGEAPVLLLWALAEDIRALLRLRAGIANGRNIRDLARELRLWGSKQTWAEPALRRIGARNLASALTECARIDQQIKGVEAGDAWLSLRVLLLKLSREPVNNLT